MDTIEKIKLTFELLSHKILTNDEALEKIGIVTGLGLPLPFIIPLTAVKTEPNHSEIAKRAYSRHHPKCVLCNENYARKKLNEKDVCTDCYFKERRKVKVSDNHFYRRKNLTNSELNYIKKRIDEKTSVANISKEMKIKIATIYNVVDRLKLKLPEQKHKKKEHEKIDANIEEQVYSRRNNGENFADIAHSLGFSNSETRNIYIKFKIRKRKEIPIMKEIPIPETITQIIPPIIPPIEKTNEDLIIENIHREENEKHNESLS